MCVKNNSFYNKYNILDKFVWDGQFSQVFGGSFLMVGFRLKLKTDVNIWGDGERFLEILEIKLILFVNFKIGKFLPSGCD